MVDELMQDMGIRKPYPERYRRIRDGAIELVNAYTEYVPSKATSMYVAAAAILRAGFGTIRMSEIESILEKRSYVPLALNSVCRRMEQLF